MNVVRRVAGLMALAASSVVVSMGVAQAAGPVGQLMPAAPKLPVLSDIVPVTGLLPADK